MSKTAWGVIVMLICWGGRCLVEALRLERVLESGHTPGDRLFDLCSLAVCLVATVLVAALLALEAQKKAKA